MAKQEEIFPIYVIAGKDVHLRSKAILTLRKGLLGDDEGMGEIRYDGNAIDLPTVLDELRTLAFLADRKVVIVEDADKFVSSNREDLETYFKDPSPNGSLILICDTWLKTTRLAKLVAKIGKVVPAESLKGKSLTQWVVDRAAELGKEITWACANDLVTTVGSETGRLANELEKLAMYVGDRRHINGPDITELCGVTAQENIFQMTDLMADGKSGEALALLDRILQMDKSAEFTLVGVMSFSIRRLLKARAMLDGGISQREICSACKIYPAIAQRFFVQLKRFSTRRLQGLVSELTQVDYANKTGLGQARLNLEKFIVCASLKK